MYTKNPNSAFFQKNVIYGNKGKCLHPLVIFKETKGEIKLNGMITIYLKNYNQKFYQLKPYVPLCMSLLRLGPHRAIFRTIFRIKMQFIAWQTSIERDITFQRNFLKVASVLVFS